jgi:uncharacterized membrane protein
MADIEGLLNRWQSAGVLEPGAVERIRAWESEQKHAAGPDAPPQRQVHVAGVMQWQGMVALILGGLLLACGVVLFVSAHWDDIGPAARFALVISMVAMFHLGGGIAREKYHDLSTVLHAVGTVATGAAIALVGQIFNIQEHWPAAVLMWAVAALAGWALLHDQAQQTLSLLLVPAWMLSEIEFYSVRHIGAGPYLGRLLFVWAILYLTLFLGSRRKVVQGILLAVAAIGSAAGVGLMIEGWKSWSSEQTFVPLSTRIWAWVAIAAVPLLLSLFKPRKTFIPVSAALAVALILPWAQRVWTDHYDYGPGVKGTFSRNEPNLLAYALVAGFAVFLIWWGVRQASKALVNFGIVGFAIAVGWFYFSSIFDKVGRSLGLIGLGILFLAGGWALEKMRRRLLAHMGHGSAPALEAQ